VRAVGLIVLNTVDDLKMISYESTRTLAKSGRGFLDHSEAHNGADDPTRTDDLLYASEARSIVGLQSGSEWVEDRRHRCVDASDDRAPLNGFDRSGG